MSESGHRYLQPETGRWVSRDPKAEKSFIEVVGSVHMPQDSYLKTKGGCGKHGNTHWQVPTELSGLVLLKRAACKGSSKIIRLRAIVDFGKAGDDQDLARAVSHQVQEYGNLVYSVRREGRYLTLNVAQKRQAPAYCDSRLAWGTRNASAYSYTFAMNQAISSYDAIGLETAPTPGQAYCYCQGLTGAGEDALGCDGLTVDICDGDCWIYPKVKQGCGVTIVKITSTCEWGFPVSTSPSPN